MPVARDLIPLLHRNFNLEPTGSVMPLPTRLPHEYLIFNNFSEDFPEK